MQKQYKTVSQSVRSEVCRHAHAILKLEETARKIAGQHNCRNDTLIRQALLGHIKQQRQLAQL